MKKKNNTKFQKNKNLKKEKLYIYNPKTTKKYKKNINKWEKNRKSFEIYHVLKYFFKITFKSMNET